VSILPTAFEQLFAKKGFLDRWKAHCEAVCSESSIQGYYYDVSVTVSNLIVQ
jgi:hypothetical protein